MTEYWLIHCFKVAALLTEDLQGIAQKCIISIACWCWCWWNKQNEKENRKEINKEHKRKWPDNACCTIANKASTERQSKIRRQQPGSLLIEICLQYLFSLNFSSHTHTRHSLFAQEIHLTCFDWSIRYTAPVFSWSNEHRKNAAVVACTMQKEGFSVSFRSLKAVEI